MAALEIRKDRNPTVLRKLANVQATSEPSGQVLGIGIVFGVALIAWRYPT